MNQNLILMDSIFVFLLIIQITYILYPLTKIAFAVQQNYLLKLYVIC